MGYMDNMVVTRELSKYLDEKGISITALSKATGYTLNVLYPSLKKDGKRPLRADEYLNICKFIEVEPFRFLVTKKDGE